MKITDLPEITFADADVEEMLANARKIVEELLGRPIERADPLMLLLKSFLAIIMQQRLLINDLARQNLLAYSRGDVLDHMGILVGVERLPASSATTTMQLRLSAPRQKTTVINKGTRITAGDGINFALDEAVIFLAGETSATVKATCTEVGEVGNDYEVGEINKIVDPQAFLAVAENLTISEGGADVESDDDYRLRIQEAPESFSVAGPSGAYEFFTKRVSTLINDVYVESENPGEVSVWTLLKGGELPGEELLAAIDESLNDRNIRPLTDHVLVKVPEIVNFDVDVQYFVNRSDATNASGIVDAAEKAVADFVEWQKEKLGRDINPSELEKRIMQTGAKRVVITSPTFTKTKSYQVAVAENISVNFGGLEDD